MVIKRLRALMFIPMLLLGCSDQNEAQQSDQNEAQQNEVKSCIFRMSPVQNEDILAPSDDYRKAHNELIREYPTSKEIRVLNKGIDGALLIMGSCDYISTQVEPYRETIRLEEIGFRQFLEEQGIEFVPNSEMTTSSTPPDPLP